VEEAENESRNFRSLTRISSLHPQKSLLSYKKALTTLAEGDENEKSVTSQSHMKFNLQSTLHGNNNIGSTESPVRNQKNSNSIA
jgi:hypothetical protein